MQDLYVETPQALAELCEKLSNSPWLTLDTEFIREKTYHPQLCLLQVANTDLVACVDPLALDDLSPLLDVLYNPNIVKIFHAAHQDLEILYRMRGSVPQPLFDTQIAAALLGYGDQIGYGGLVKEMLNVDLDKSHSRTDWSLRPLSPDQIRYAADDVRYLRDVYLQQMEALDQLGRLDWLQEDFQSLADPHSYDAPVENLWQRIRGNHTLKGAQLAILRALAAWREEEARNQDKPRKWVLHDDVLLELARRQPKDHQGLSRIRGLETGAQRRHGSALLALIRETRDLPRDQWPQLAPRLRLSQEQEAAVDALMAVTRLSGIEHSISVASLTTRKELEKLISGERDINILRGWRAALCGNKLQALLEGKLTLRMEQGQLRTHTEGE